MKRASALAIGAWSAGLIWACSGGSGGAGSPGSPAIQSVAPSRLFRGRSTAISIAAVNAAFSDASQVQIAGGQIAVSKVHALSGEGLRAVAAVPVDFPAAQADLAADGLSASAAFDVADAVKVNGAPQVQQGDSVDVVLLNLDADNPFDGTAAVDGGKDLSVAVTDVSGSALAATIAALPSATTGAHDLTVKLAGGAQALVKAAVTVGALKTTPFVPKMDNAVTVPKGADRAVLSVSAIAGKLFDARLGMSGMMAPPRTAFALIDPAVGFPAPLSVAFGPELLAAAKAPDQALLYVILVDAPFASDQALTIDGDIVTPAAASETEPNEDFMTANAVTAPVLITAALDKKTDSDVFAVTVTAGTLVARTLPDDSVMQKYPTDTKIDIFDASQKPLASNDDEEPNSTYSFAVAAVTAGTAYVRVGSGEGAVADGGAYRLAIMVR